MKLVTFAHNGDASVGLFTNNALYSLHTINPVLPKDMASFLKDWETNSALARSIEVEIHAGKHASVGLAYNPVA